ncbi:hydroxymethylbutenyl pyrophosphate reductase [Desulfonatronospira thiodismutans ASO3-1]|uniref:4-hydroxy-3-methylbut-2-enyl diphosphate reductase n=1 Tax=Desulfonatronospira thiodismutans ASO3-1 TaxID=555779 RepID=D6SMQ6_9BACT|nr:MULTISPECIES: 4-hydroxy-3-methylbut-2-enyl diphosphate reductase [Desulfonatronospira]EFI35967.1 hydroxymethylbutenyl pyrophosphate reductase [Desulfonatronospira thiodismutans ASO3-1]RQD79317.1 MAG: 4-hydroxy-3-methylbut-2-enyl diphosphate reductase [Desulfonatronospira sp. MSAO_Bac3]
MSTQVLLAESAGFCMGVSLALGKLDKALENQTSQRIFTYGPIIHNPQVLEYYHGKGVKIIDNWDEPRPGDMVLIRAHGVPLQVEEKLREKNIDILDATCPKVKKAQLLIYKNSAVSDRLLIYGELDHPEVKGLLSYAQCEAFLFENMQEFKKIALAPKDRYCLVSQTTQDRQEFLSIASELKHSQGNEIITLDTICDATKDRQNETIKIAGQVECMFVVGGRNSGNTRRLYQVARKYCPRCLHIETKEEIDPEMVKGCSKVGLTAGASTPNSTIQSIYQYLHRIINSQDPSLTTRRS